MGREATWSLCSAELGILEVRLRDLGCSCCLFAIAFVALCSRWRVTAVLGAAGAAWPRRLSTAELVVKAAGLWQEQCSRARGCSCHLQSIIATLRASLLPPSLPWPVPPTQQGSEGLSRGSVWWVESTSPCRLSSGAGFQHSSISSPGLCSREWTDRMSCW